MRLVANKVYDENKISYKILCVIISLCVANSHHRNRESKRTTMPYEMSWLVEKRVIYARMYGHMTSEELTAYYQSMLTHARVSELLLHTLTDTTDITRIDMGLRDLQNMSFAGIRNLGWAVFISPSKINRFFASVITQLSKKRGRQFATLEEGLKFLQDIDDTLPPITLPIKRDAA